MHAWRLTTAAALSVASLSWGCSTAFESSETGPDKVDVSIAGCSDGTRDEFTDTDAEPDIAGCSGGFNIAGVTSMASLSPQCDRKAGNDSDNPDGGGCSVADLCGAGWHVCASASELGSKAKAGGCPPVAAGTFWVSRQAQDGNSMCAAMGENNMLGCGADDVGQMATPDCQPLNREMRYTHCQMLPPWQCGDASGANSEATLVTKAGPAAGGALCCRD